MITLIVISCTVAGLGVLAYYGWKFYRQQGG